MTAAIEISARWCVDCGMDLFLSESPRVIAEEIVLCDLCAERDRRVVIAAEDYLYELLPQTERSKKRLWNRFEKRIAILMGDDAIDVFWWDNLKWAYQAIRKRDAKALRKEIDRVLDDDMCELWENRLMIMRRECQLLLKEG